MLLGYMLGCWDLFGYTVPQERLSCCSCFMAGFKPVVLVRKIPKRFEVARTSACKRCSLCFIWLARRSSRRGYTTFEFRMFGCYNS
jgi:hypothetical protein